MRKRGMEGGRRGEVALPLPAVRRSSVGGRRGPRKAKQSRASKKLRRTREEDDVTRLWMDGWIAVPEFY